MSRQRNLFWISYLILAFLVVLRIFPLLDNGIRAWGFNHLIFLPYQYSIGFFIIAVIALVIPFIFKSGAIGQRLADWFSRLFIETKYNLIYRMIFILAMAGLFAVLVMPTHFLGDGYMVINNLASQEGILVKWSEIGVIKLMKGVLFLLGSSDRENSRLAFQIINC